MDNDLDALIRGVSLDGQPLDPIDYDEATRTWWTALTLEDPPGTERTFELQFRHTDVIAFDTSPYLVVSWIVFPQDELKSGAATDLWLYQAVNNLHSDPGAKFRIESNGGDPSLVCDVDLAINLLSPELLRQAIE